MPETLKWVAKPEPQCDGEPQIGIYRHGSKAGTPMTVKCGTYVGGEKQFCDAHQAYYEALYPQGWTGYPGDTCKHGVYVGGCGRDIGCIRCEHGDDEDEE